MLNTHSKKASRTCINLWGKNKIGKGTTIGAYCDIGNVTIGENCNIQCHVSIPPGWKIGNNVFIGPGVRFANDKYPNTSTKWNMLQGEVKDGAVIGMNATIGAGLTIGKNSVVGMGSVVTKNIPDNETWYGNSARKQ